MSDYTPITGKLRDAMCQWGWVERDGSIMFTTSPIPSSIDAEQSLAISGSDFDRLCDSIDAIHAQLEKENAALKVELDRVLGEQEEAIQQALMGEGGVPATDENMAEHGWLRLPLDANDKYIHEHDKVDWRDHAGTWHENATVVAVCNDGCYVMDGTVFHVHKSDIRHHHAPTVEDVLREFADGIKDQNADFTELVIAEYAKRLQLREDA